MSDEAWVQFRILESWGAHPRLRIWRANTGAALLNGRMVRFGVPGQADISGLIWPSGQRLEIECKTRAGKQRESQIAWERMIRRMGGVYCLARSLEDVDRCLAEVGITR